MILKTNTKKNVLLVTETPPGTPNGFGVTLDALFGDIKPSVIYTDQEFESSVNNEQYLLAHVPFHRSKRYLPSFLLGKIPEWRNYYSRKWIRSKILSSYEIVYSFVYSGSCLAYGAWLSKFLNAKHYVHIADHQDAFIEDEGLVNTIKSAYSRVSIGYNMKMLYEKHFEQKFEIFHNAVSYKSFPFQRLKDATFNNNRKLKVLFLGSLFENLHSGAIEDICDAITSIGKDGSPIQLDIYGQRQPGSFLEDKLNGPHVRHLGTIESIQRFNLMEDYDCYVIPATFDPNLSIKYSYSIPAKLTEVLSAGRPVLFYGPECMEAFRFCKLKKAGALVTERSLDKIIRFFHDLINNFPKHEEKSQKWASNIIEEYSVQTTRKSFETFINS